MAQVLKRQHENKARFAPENILSGFLSLIKNHNCFLVEETVYLKVTSEPGLHVFSFLKIKKKKKNLSKPFPVH